jgi:hypothetical protein
MNQDMIREARRIIAEVSRAPELGKRQVEALLGVPLIHSPDARPDLRYHQAQLPSGPFARVELREPNPQQNQDWRLLVLEARDGVALSLQDLTPDIAASSMRVNPDIPPEGVVTYTAAPPMSRPGQTISLDFWALRKTLRLVSFQRGKSH